MTRSIDPLFDPRLADWLEEDENAAPEQTLEIVLASYPSIKQRRAVRLPRRTTSMSSTLRLGLVAAVVIAAALGGVYFFGSRSNSPVGGPSTPAPSATTSTSEPSAAAASNSPLSSSPSSSPAATVLPLGEIRFSLPYHSCEHLPSVSAEVPIALGPAFTLEVFDGERLVAASELRWLGAGDDNVIYDPARDVDGDGLVTAVFGVVSGVFPQTGEDTRLDVQLTKVGRIVAQGVYECEMLRQ